MFRRPLRMQACIFQSAWKRQDAAFAMLMLAKVTLLAVMLFLAWPDKWSEVCVCDLFHMCFCFGQFCFLSLPFFFFLHFICQAMNVRLRNGWDPQCCCQLVSVESYGSACRDAPWRRSICPRSLTIIWVWFGPVSMHSNPEGSVLRVTWKKVIFEQSIWALIKHNHFFHCCLGKKYCHLSSRSLYEWITVAEASSLKYYINKYIIFTIIEDVLLYLHELYNE